MCILVFSLADSRWYNLCFIYAEGKVFIMLKICVLYLSPAICFRGKSAFFMSLALKLHGFQLFSESGHASKDLSFFKIWCLKWKAAMLFIHCALRNSFSQMEGHKNDGLLSCSLKLHSLNTWNIDIKSSCTWFSPYESFQVLDLCSLAVSF